MTGQRLVVNADDAGLAESTDDAILHCFEHGVVRSASVIVNGDTAASFVERATAVGLDLGLHLNLTEGLPLTGSIPGLVDRAGRFLGDKATAWERLCDPSEIDPQRLADEARAQWDALVSLGTRPSHLDGHNHVHVFPCVHAAIAPLCAGIVVRNPIGIVDSPPPCRLPSIAKSLPSAIVLDAFTGFGFTSAPCASIVERALDTASGSMTMELMVHPGARRGSRFTEDSTRDVETDVLCDPALRTSIEARGWRVSSFAELIST